MSKVNIYLFLITILTIQSQRTGFCWFLFKTIVVDFDFKKTHHFQNTLGLSIFEKNKSLKKKVLFVCLGNICRSPSAEAVFNGIVAKHGVADQFIVDSAGTSGYHAGEMADARMQQHARKRGYELTSISRKFNPARDFDQFDYIIGMDAENVDNLRLLARGPGDLAKIHLMTDFSETTHSEGVPDPYYGGSRGFELVLDLLEQAGTGLFNQLTKKLK